MFAKTGLHKATVRVSHGRLVGTKELGANREIVRHARKS